MARNKNTQASGSFVSTIELHGNWIWRQTIATCFTSQCDASDEGLNRQTLVVNPEMTFARPHATEIARFASSAQQHSPPLARQLRAPMSCRARSAPTADLRRPPPTPAPPASGGPARCRRKELPPPTHRRRRQRLHHLDGQQESCAPQLPDHVAMDAQQHGDRGMRAGSRMAVAPWQPAVHRLLSSISAIVRPEPPRQHALAEQRHGSGGLFLADHERSLGSLSNLVNHPMPLGPSASATTCSRGANLHIGRPNLQATRP
jgi:hypothetical protein